MPAAVVGRSAELRSIERLLRMLDDGPGVLVLEGEPGIGKTTLLRAAIDAAGRRGVRVLACTAAASETRLSYAGLTDLLATVDATEYPRLPAAQRAALDAALLRAGPAGAAIDPRAVATAVLSVLEALAERGPVLVAIDDLQWLDRPSARVAEFCARRHSGRVGTIAARRPGAGTGWFGAPTRLPEPGRVALCRLDPLADDEVALVVRDRAGRPLARRPLLRVVECAGGNPFYALELARALAASRSPAAELVLPETLEEIVDGRVTGLSREAEEALLAAAAMAQPTISMLERALGRDVTGLLDEAEERGVVERDGERVRFSHPLLATGVYRRASGPRRRALHARLGAVVTDPEARARHLARGRATDAVPALEEAARHARARGAPESAADLLELALERRDDPRLRALAAEHHFDAGDNHRARALLEAAIPRLADGRERAAALLLLGEVSYKDDSFDAARALLEQARTQAGRDARLRVMIDLRLTFVTFNLGAVPEAGAIAHRALRLAERLGDAPILAAALAASAMLDFCLGRGLDERRLTRALALEDPPPRQTVEFQPSLIASSLFFWTGRLDDARARLDAYCARAAERGDEHGLAWASFFRVSIECRAGDLLRATAAMEEACRRLLMLDTANGRVLSLCARAQVDAHAGRAQQARAEAEEMLDLLGRTGWRTWSALALAILGFVEVSLGDFRAAAARLEPLAAAAVATGLPEPTVGGLPAFGDAAEAFIAVGRLDEAERIVSLLEERGAALDRPWALAVGARCRALLLARAGDLPAAELALARALAAHARLPVPLERARTLLVLGSVRRRGRSRLAAKAALDEALAIFEGIGAPRWAARARDEIERLGLRPGAPTDLTPSEERVARLAASGMTLRDIAAALVLSPKTVEAHLGRAYRKLGIRSRAQLAVRMSAAEATGGEARPASPV